jgi:putative ABC transport system permease protein
MTLIPFEYAVRNLGRSPLRLALSVCGSALVVLLVLLAGAFVSGMERSLRQSANPHNIIVLGAGSEESIERSEVGAGTASLLTASIPGIRSELGIPFVSPEVHISLPLSLHGHADRQQLVMVRGITPGALLVHEQVQIVRGRLPEPGRDELMVGRLVARQMGVRQQDVAPGASLWLDGRPWQIVGEFIAPATVMEAEVWTSLTDLKTATRRESDSCVVLRLDAASGAELADVDAFCKQRLDLELAALAETEYYAALGAFFRPLQVVAWVTALLIALGGLLGGLNTMYAAVAMRIRELGALQTLGFRRSAIVISLIQESLLAAAAGALIACALGVLVLDGLAVRFSMGAFGLVVDAPVLSLALLAGLALGLLGALPPAWRCLRMPIPEALRAV